MNLGRKLKFLLGNFQVSQVLFEPQGYVPFVDDQESAIALNSDALNKTTSPLFSIFTLHWLTDFCAVLLHVAAYM